MMKKIKNSEKERKKVAGARQQKRWEKEDHQHSWTTAQVRKYQFDPMKNKREKRDAKLKILKCEQEKATKKKKKKQTKLLKVARSRLLHGGREKQSKSGWWP